ncbi:MAG: hypothetical protein ACOCZ5_03445, partial [bacterium]
DQEIEVTIVLTNGDIDDIVNFNDDNYSFIWERITDQIRGQFDPNKELKEIIKLLVEENSILLGPDGYGLTEMEIENVTKD